MTGKNWETRFLDLCGRDYRRFYAANGVEDLHVEFSFREISSLALWGLFRESETERRTGTSYPVRYGKTKREAAEKYMDTMFSANGVESVEELELLLESEGM